MMNFLASGGRSEVNSQHSYEVDSTFYMVTCKYDEEGRQILVRLIYKKRKRKINKFTSQIENVTGV